MQTLDHRAPERRLSRERRQTRIYRFHERRSAFDRRRSYPLLGALRDDGGLLLTVLVAMNAMSVYDGLLTLTALREGVASELNPLLAVAFSAHPHMGLVVKVCVLLLVSLLVWHWRRYRLVLAAALAGLAIFAGVIVYHVGQLRSIGLV